MQTNLADFIKDTPEGQEANAILRACVHCGFCNATCPTYQLLGDELDGPRGRIYLIKQVLEGAKATAKTQLHLDRCLSCRACETTCPAGVNYGRLLDIGREIVKRQAERDPIAILSRKTLRKTLLSPSLFDPLLRAGQIARPFLPGFLKDKVPRRYSGGAWPAARHPRKMLVLDGCVQPALAPNINAAAARVLDRIGISLLRAERAGCCGALSYHLDAQEEGLDSMRRNVDAWWPHVERGVEAIVMTASGCGVTVKEYGRLLAHDVRYAAKAERISTLAKDISEIVAAEPDQIGILLRNSKPGTRNPKLAFHSPCTLQHGMRITGVVEKILAAAGFELTPAPDSHLCCGSAGAYSILQPALAKRLLANKVKALESGAPAQIATANIGCLMHIQGGAALPVRHWIEVLDEVLGQSQFGTGKRP